MCRHTQGKAISKSKVHTVLSVCKHLRVVAPATVSLLFSVLTVTYIERRTHVHRTPYARTPNAVRTYTERRTSSFRPLSVVQPAISLLQGGRLTEKTDVNIMAISYEYLLEKCYLCR